MKSTALAALATALLLFAIIALLLVVANGRVSLPAASAAAQERSAQATTAATVATTAPAAATSAPQVGEQAPDFRLPYATHERIYARPDEWMALSSLRGRNVILAFYPADWSGGCTREVCTLRDTFAELSRLNATVLGVSGDYVFSHHEWAKHHNLQFPLLSDHNHAVARRYASYDEASGYNKRTVYLIDSNGIVRYVNLNFRAGAPEDYNRLRAELERLAPAGERAAPAPAATPGAN